MITQFRRFIDEVINSLVYDASTLKIEKEAIHEQYELTRFALHEAGNSIKIISLLIFLRLEKVKRDVEEARLQVCFLTNPNMKNRFCCRLLIYPLD